MDPVGWSGKRNDEGLKLSCFTLTALDSSREALEVLQTFRGSRTLALTDAFPALRRRSFPRS